MKILWVFAHPDHRSLNGALLQEGLSALRAQGHDVRVSDLYAMRWKATVDADDYSHHEPGARLRVAPVSEVAQRGGTLSPDIEGEQRKLGWADAVVFQFPLWWYGMPAILKGWFDRVFVKGFAYGVRDPHCPGRTLRYGEGKLAGKRALTVVTAGSPPAPMGPRGVNGELDLVLFGLLHGTLWYAGMSVLPPFAVYGADRLPAPRFDTDAASLRERVLRMDEAEPLPYRRQNGGDYDDDLVLRPDLAPGATGLAVHYADDVPAGTCRPRASSAGTASYRRDGR
jgi:NAD(P)H dehydrogenase (quinone)